MPMNRKGPLCFDQKDEGVAPHFTGHRSVLQALSQTLYPSVCDDKLSERVKQENVSFTA